MSAWILAVDLGTGGPKVAAVRPDGEVLAWVARSLPTTSRADGTSTQDARNWRTEVIAAVRECVAAAGVSGDDLQSVGITGQWGSTVPVGPDGEPSGDVLLWSDSRASDYIDEVIGGRVSVQGYAPQKVLPWVRKSGGAPSVSGNDPTGHSIMLKRAMPEVYAATALLMEPVDYVGLLLTGRAAATPASMTLSWLTDNRMGATHGYDDSLVARAHRDRNRLPELVPTGSVLGGLDATIAAEMGVRSGAPVICGVPDLHAAVIGSGAVAPYDSHVSISTTSWLGARVPFKKTDIIHSIATIPGLDPQHPLVANNHETAGAALEWLRANVFAGTSYDELMSLASSVAPGCDGLLFTPWLDGERSPVDDKRLRASFVHMSIETHRAAMMRAVLEGVALNAKWLMDAYEKFLGRPVTRLRILGGGAMSDLWCQIHADALGVPVERVADPRAAQLRGVALWTRICLGEISLDEAAALVPVDRVFTPQATEVMARNYAEFQRLYKALKGIHHRLG